MATGAARPIPAPPLRRTLASIAALALATFAMPNAAVAASKAATEAPSSRPGDKVYILIGQHDPIKFSNALKAGGDFLAAGSGKGRVFEIALTGRGILLAIPGSTTAQRDYIAAKRAHPELRLLVCKETADVLQKANKRRIPYLPGVRIAPCRDLLANYSKDGYQRALGF
ncbi:hypothetical protein SAMN02745172_02521 [Pseudoxanthobacter soli DSM 19599]|uniref:DsrE/DsrF-like family protein n=1 Tax=Pseudoxanthobacter soli DSM 19599 TaxID=1123029 RepID=A0A1M7ZLU2_9HYPH|nr:hypothetical protein [Pseudoxanthobacter soli]SHO65873.1 hypothetical protein SAMN02745172_02521 [Pseudoxanthobacter soli DSM 19599]